MYPKQPSGSSDISWNSRGNPQMPPATQEIAALLRNDSPPKRPLIRSFFWAFFQW